MNIKLNLVSRLLFRIELRDSRFFSNNSAINKEKCLCHCALLNLRNLLHISQRYCLIAMTFNPFIIKTKRANDRTKCRRNVSSLKFNEIIYFYEIFLGLVTFSSRKFWSTFNAIEMFRRLRYDHQSRSIANKFVKRVQYNAYLPGACPSSGTFSSDKIGTGSYDVGRWDSFCSLDMSTLGFSWRSSWRNSCILKKVEDLLFKFKIKNFVYIYLKNFKYYLLEYI